MKKLYFLMALLALSLCGCQKNYVAKLGEISVEPHYCSAGSLISDYVEEDNENQSYLQYVKHCVSGLRNVEIYSELDWEQFDAVDSAYKIREAGMFNIPACLDINNVDAIYIEGELNGILFCPKMAQCDAEQQFLITTHELCHALLGGCAGTSAVNAFIVEGEVELLAYAFTQSLGIDLSIDQLAYKNGVLVALWLNELFGPGKIYRSLLDDDVDQLIDSIAGEGVCKDFNLAGYMTTENPDNKLALNAEIEILCELSAKMGKSEIGEKWLEVFVQTFKKGGIDQSHMKKILSVN